MAHRVYNYEVRALRRAVEPLRLSDHAFRTEFGFSIAEMGDSEIRGLVFAILAEWFNDEDRSGSYGFGKNSHHTYLEKTTSPHLLVYISDPNVRLEFKLRWC